MKQTKISISIGMAVTFAAFIAMAIGAVFTWNWLFFIGVGLLLLGIACMMVVPAVIISRWNKLMNEHGVPATAKLISCTKTTGAMAEIRLEFLVTDTDIMTTGIVSVNSKKEFILDSVWNIKYDPDNTVFCLVVSEVAKNADAVKAEDMIDTAAADLNTEDGTKIADTADKTGSADEINTDKNVNTEKIKIGSADKTDKDKTESDDIADTNAAKETITKETKIAIKPEAVAVKKNAAKKIEKK